MKTAPLATESLVQLLTVAGVHADTRASAREAHVDGEPVQLIQRPDFTFVLEFEGGAKVVLSYEAGNLLATSLKR